MKRPQHERVRNERLGMSRLAGAVSVASRARPDLAAPILPRHDFLSPSVLGCLLDRTIHAEICWHAAAGVATGVSPRSNVFLMGIVKSGEAGKGLRPIGILAIFLANMARFPRPAYAPWRNMAGTEEKTRMRRLPRTLRQLILAGLFSVSLLSMTGCQTDVGGQTLPSPYYMYDDVQYFPPGPEFKLAREAAAMKAYSDDASVDFTE